MKNLSVVAEASIYPVGCKMGLHAHNLILPQLTPAKDSNTNPCNKLLKILGSCGWTLDTIEVVFERGIIESHSSYPASIHRNWSSRCLRHNSS